MGKDFYTEVGNDGCISDFEPMVDIFEEVDCLVDITNGWNYQNEWKDDAGGFSNKFITKQSYEDLVWMIFGLAGVCCTYLEDDGSSVIHQGRSGTDC
eukprot:4968530-Ditylum_brightwellii.AAC.1